MSGFLTVYQVPSYDYINLENFDVHLVISSVPLEIIDSESSFYDLFSWFDTVVVKDGTIIIDCPYTRLAGMRHFAFDSRYGRWSYKWSFVYRDFYQKGDKQSVVAFSKGLTPKPKRKFFYNRCYDRVMSHECEYDPDWVRNVIESLTCKGEMVLDPFCGTGTVLRVARIINRNAVGLDRRCPFTNNEVFYECE